MSESLQEKCGIVGVVSENGHAAVDAYTALRLLQHRGYDAAGIAAYDGEEFSMHRGLGTVDEVFSEYNLLKLPGKIAVAQDRYSTNGAPSKHAQPINFDKVTGVHNGEIADTTQLKEYLDKQHIPHSHLNDSEKTMRVIDDRVEQGDGLPDAVEYAGSLAVGAFALVVSDGEEIVAYKDRHGTRPLELAETKYGYAVASETVATDKLGSHLRSVKPGEMVIIGADGSLRTRQTEAGQPHLDLFEIAYFADPRSRLYDRAVGEVRYGFGVGLADMYPVIGKNRGNTLVVPVPASADPAAHGYADAAGLEYAEVLLKREGSGRSFLQPTQEQRQAAVGSKFIALMDKFEDRDIVYVDDTGVRFNTIKPLIQIAKEGNARSVSVLMAAPPVRYPDFYGIDISNQNELAAANKSLEQIRREIGAKMLGFLSLENMIAATGRPKEDFHRACFDGEYIIPIGNRCHQIHEPVSTGLMAAA